MITTTLTFESSLPHDELDEILPKLELIFENRFAEATSIDFVKHSDKKFDAVIKLNAPKDVADDVFVDEVLPKEKVNMALFEVGLTGFLI